MVGTAGARDTIFDPGRRLPPQALARFVALAGAAPDLVEPLLANPPPASPSAPLWLGSPWWPIDLDRVAGLGMQLAGVSDIDDLCDRLNRFWDSARGSEPVHGLLLRSPAGLDVSWLVELLVQQGPMASVMFESWSEPSQPIDWPLRVGLPPSGAGKDLAQTLNDGWFRELYDPVVVRGGEAIDILLFPGPLSQALRSARRSEQRQASLVVVLGGVDQPAPLDALHDLGTHLLATAVAVCDLGASHWPTFFYQLVAELSHNLPFPMALFEACRRLPTDAGPLWPVVLGNPDYVGRNRPLDVARRLAEHLWQLDERPLEPLPELLPFADGGDKRSTNGSVANALDKAAEQWPWTSETQGATMLVRTRRALEQQLGPIDLRIARREMAMAYMAPPTEVDDDLLHISELSLLAGTEVDPAGEPVIILTPPPATRHVKFDLEPAIEATPGLAPATLLPHTDRRLEVFIAEAQVAATVTADAPLDETLLPTSEDGHDLDIVYCPLSPIGEADGRSHIPAPTRSTLHLPPIGSSSRATFTLRCGATVADFRARLIVLHAQRVIQSLLLLPDARGCLTLTVENRYAPGFDSPSADVPADLAFLINDNPDGASGLTTLAPERASFLTPDGLKESIAQMRKILNAAVVAEAGQDNLTLNRPALLDLMRQLANHGAVIVEELSMQHPLAQLDAARRVQVVEAVDQAYFPVEYLYAGPAPEPGAALCPNALAALADGGDAVHDQCPHKNDEGHVCPASFWGFRKCIERHAPNGDSATVISVPVPGQERLGPFGSALLAASDRARDEMAGPHGLPASVATQVADVTTVSTWAEWKAQVMARPRDLLLLMPHSDKSSVFAGIPSLEVSKDELAASNLSEKYVHTGDRHGPLVLLLGCSTSFADLPFLNFVRRFHLKGAPAVVGTLSVVHASQAHHIAERLLNLAAAPQEGALRLDEALLKLRRALLAEGNGVSFTLMAYGHSAWRL